jgi:hypothetical protein
MAAENQTRLNQSTTSSLSRIFPQVSTIEKVLLFWVPNRLIHNTKIFFWAYTNKAYWIFYEVNIFLSSRGLEKE